MTQFGSEICRRLEASLTREWLETNGLGGFASSTINGLNTRRYHGLLVAATRPPVGRVVMLSKLEETLILDGQHFELSANRYGDVIHPQGYRYQTGFRLDPFPVFTYLIEGIEIEKSVFMVQGENTTVVQYELRDRGGSSAHSAHAERRFQLELRPLIAFRDYHSTTHENGALNPHVQMEGGVASVAPYPDLPPLYLAHAADEIDAQGYWYRNFNYERERERGLDFAEDLFSPFSMRLELREGKRLSLIASTQKRCVACDGERFRREEIERRAKLIARSPVDDPLVRRLVAAADQYIVARGRQKTIIAGYHWFSDWGRDTMIALPGLTLLTGRIEVARSILAEFARHVDRGMLPNRFPDAGEPPEYNTVDATLWYFEAVRAFLQYSEDDEFVHARLYDVLVDIIEWHERGTRYGIRVTDDGLLAAGEEGVQLTWMDAKVGDWVVTPRRGKAVEIEALWYNALRVMEQLAGRFGDDGRRKVYREMAARVRASFNRLFWNAEAGCLYDVVDADARDGSIRPNQILAVSLPHSMLDAERSRSIVAVVRRELLTPRGLRTLAPGSQRYKGRYGGDQRSRDGAYHQGTVWPWLMGPFIKAFLKTAGKSEEARRQARVWLEGFAAHLDEACLGHVSEIFDGDSPHAPRGCVAQAWSVAELLRAAVEDVYSRKPVALGLAQAATPFQESKHAA